MEKKELINLTIINDSDCTLSIPLFQNNVPSINATTKYQWDITSGIGANTYIYTIDDTNVYGDLDLCTASITNILCGLGSIIVNGVLITITYAPTLVGLLDSLNALGYGFFCTEFITSITTTTTSTTTTSTTAIPTTTTSTTSTTTTGVPTTSTTTTSTTPIPTTTTSTTSTTTTEVPTTSTTTTSTTPIPTTTTTTSTTTSTTTLIPTTTTTSTTTTSTTPIPTTTTTTSTTTSTTTPIPTTTTSTTTTTTTTNAVFSCGTNDTTFDTSAIFDLGTQTGYVTITGSGLTAGNTYNIIYPVGGLIIHTTVPVDGSGNLTDDFYWIYDSVNSNVEITLVLP